ncbi:MAG: DUF3820 family protein [Desulfobacteraceae bacterium]|nr:DUF3820 family protein [Desulfobacteraceae bacterium]
MILEPDKAAFIKLATTKMPFGKYKGLRLVDIPEPYLVWLSRKGFPKNNIGEMLQTMYEIKLNGLEYLFNAFGSLEEPTRKDPGKNL